MDTEVVARLGPFWLDRKLRAAAKIVKMQKRSATLDGRGGLSNDLLHYSNRPLDWIQTSTARVPLRMVHRVGSRQAVMQSVGKWTVDPVAPCAICVKRLQ
jgi:hypothetical protein